jgi:signal transduction histidine kinase
VSPAPAPGSAPSPVAPPAPQRGGGAAPAANRMALKNWRVRSRLLLLIAIPTLTAVILGGIRIVSSVQNALSYQRIEQLANLSSAVTGLAARMEDERDWTVLYIADGNSGRAAALAGHKAVAAPQLQLVTQQYGFTRPWIHDVQTQLQGIGAGFPPQVQQDAAAIRSVLAALPDLRDAAIETQLPALVVVTKYTSAIDSLLAVDDDIALDSGDPVLASNVRALSLISRIEEEASEQRAILAYAFTQQRFAPGVLNAVTTAQAEMNDNISEFDNSSTTQQINLYQSTVAGALVDLANAYEQQAIAFGNDNTSLTTSPTTAEEWFGAMSGKISGIRKVEQNLVSASISRANHLRRDAIIDAALIGAAIILVLGLALILTTLVGRSMVRPLRRLRAGALEVAGLRLPDTVRRMSESDGSGISLNVEPIDVDSSDEIGEVARAFDQVHREALRLAANEAALRGNVNAMFVNLSRRSQSLVERQIRLIDDLEQGEQDAERLGSLFQMDHLATRMRRNSENLLVLAGHDSSRRWNQPVALVDVLRAAVSEIEQYERVSLNVQPGISVRGHAVNDAVHLLAELAENATSFSSAETPVTISGHLLSSGGVLLDITDQGVGMGAEEMAHANWRLDNPPVVDVAVSRRMGLFVVARLAARHGIRVRLRPAASGGLTALVWLPDEVVSREAGASPSRLPDTPADIPGLNLPGRFDFNGSAPADERAATAQEVNAARTPKFTSMPSAATENGNLGPRRIPGAGPRPGAPDRPPAATGPLPAFRTSPAPADGPVDEPFATAPQQAITADAFSTGLEQAASEAGPAPVADSPVEPPAERSASGLPKRRVDRSEPAAEGAGAGTGERPASTDMFTPATSRGTGPGLGSPSRFEPPAPAAPAPAAADSQAYDTQSFQAPSYEPSGSPGSSGSSGFGAPPGDSPGTAWPDPPETAAAELAGAGNGSVFSAPVTSEFAVPGHDDPAAGGSSSASGSFGWDAGPSGGEVVVPPPTEQTTEYRLPIFEAVESDWFRRGRSSVGWAPQETAEAAAPARAESAWSSPADQGWEAAAAVAAPSSGGVTPAGLPKRVPQANLVPGTAAATDAPAPAPAPARSAAATRERFASFQRGVKEGRAAAGGSGPDGEDDGSR